MTKISFYKTKCKILSNELLDYKKRVEFFRVQCEQMKSKCEKTGRLQVKANLAHEYWESFQDQIRQKNEANEELRSYLRSFSKFRRGNALFEDRMRLGESV